MNISSAARAAARCIAAPFVALGRFARSLLSVKNVARAAPQQPRAEPPRQPSRVSGSLVRVSDARSTRANPSPETADVVTFPRADVASAVALALKNAPLFAQGEQLPHTLEARADAVDLRGELRGRTIAEACGEIMSLSPADPMFNTSDPYHYISAFTGAALERERCTHASEMVVLAEGDAIDRLVDQFLAVAEQLTQEARAGMRPASPRN